jgi:hypothetical protein
MDPFEQLVRELSALLGIPLKPDHHQSCRLDFGQGVTVQMDLDHTAERIILGSTLGRLNPGIYREQVLRQALRTNGLAKRPRGTLSYSERTDSLILFQFLTLSITTAESLKNALSIFQEHAYVWIQAIKDGGLPSLEEEIQSGKTGFMGLR